MAPKIVGKVFGHPVSRELLPNGDVKYQCQVCGIRDHGIVSFDQYGCGPRYDTR